MSGMNGHIQHSQRALKMGQWIARFYRHLGQSPLLHNLSEHQLWCQRTILRDPLHQIARNCTIREIVDKTQHGVSSTVEVPRGRQPHRRDAFPPLCSVQKSLRNAAATLLPRDRNNWTGIAAAQPHTAQLSQLTPAAGPSGGFGEHCSAVAVHRFVGVKKIENKVGEERGCLWGNATLMPPPVIPPFDICLGSNTGGGSQNTHGKHTFSKPTGTKTSPCRRSFGDAPHSASLERFGRRREEGPGIHQAEPHQLHSPSDLTINDLFIIILPLV